MTPRFGRLPAPDPRDRLFLMARLLDPLRDRFFPRGLSPGTRYYPPGPVMSQGDTGTCVGHGWAAFLEGAPLMTARRPELAPFALYDACTAVDEFPENDHDVDRQDGTSVRAGAKVLQQWGHISSYLWAESVEDAIAWHLANFGTLVLGVDWRTGMMQTDAAGFIHATGGIEGGHCVKTTGWSQTRKAFRIQNSWGTSWGQNGRAWVRAEDLQMLLEEGGEACAAVEVKLPNGMTGGL